jgi:hypothetical protein
MQKKKKCVSYFVTHVTWEVRNHGHRWLITDKNEQKKKKKKTTS